MYKNLFRITDHAEKKATIQTVGGIGWLPIKGSHGGQSEPEVTVVITLVHGPIGNTRSNGEFLSGRIFEDDISCRRILCAGVGKVLGLDGL